MSDERDLVSEAIATAGAVPEGYSEISVDFFQFKQEGDRVEGRLINKSQTTVRGNRVGKYVLMKAGGQRITFLGGVHLDELMANVGVGNEILVEYTHKERIDETGNEMKRFKVFVKNAR